MNNEQDQSAPNVAIIRQRRGPDIIGIVLGYKTREEGIQTLVSSYLIEHPYIPMIDYSSGGYNLMPWCPFADQTVFEFHTKDVVFMSPAKKDIVVNYLKGLALKGVTTAADSDKLKGDKIAFRKALESLTLSPGTETLQ